MPKDSIVMTKQEAFQAGFQSFQAGQVRAIDGAFIQAINDLRYPQRVELMEAYIRGWDSSNIVAELVGW